MYFGQREDLISTKTRLPDAKIKDSQWSILRVGRRYQVEEAWSRSSLNNRFSLLSAGAKCSLNVAFTYRSNGQSIFHSDSRLHLTKLKGVSFVKFVEFFMALSNMLRDEEGVSTLQGGYI